MFAVSMLIPAPVLTSLSLYLTVGLLLVVGMVFAPQPVKRDRRVIAFILVFFIVVIVGHRTQAVYSDICDRFWWAIECWFASR